MISIRRLTENNKELFVFESDSNAVAKCYFDNDKAELIDLEIIESEIEQSFLEAIIKATLNHLELKGHKSTFCYINNFQKYKDLLLKIGFSINDKKNIFELSLEGYFDKPCQGQCQDCEN